MTTPQTRLWALPHAKRNELLDPAEVEFIAHGLEGASLNRILKNAGMSKGQAYHYVSGKADLFLAVCTRKFSPLLNDADTRLETPFTALPFWQHLETVCFSLAAQIANDKELHGLARAVYASSAAEDCLAPLIKQLNTLLDRLILEGQRQGVIRDDLPDDLIRDTLKGAARSIDKWFAHSAETLSPTDFDSALTGAGEMLRNLVAPPHQKDTDHA